MYNMAGLLTRIHHRATLEVKKTLLANRYYNWYVFSRQLSRAWEEEVKKHYQKRTEQTERGLNDLKHEEHGEKRKLVIAMCNGWVESGGLADRLKGIISTYLLCQEMGWDFRLHFIHPFALEDFLVPNTYDWRIDASEICYTTPDATPVTLEIGSDSRYQAKKQKEWLRQQIRQAEGKQVHVFTNAMFAYHDQYGDAFRRLFKPSASLAHAIDEQLKMLGQPYVSISARFLGVLGDFQDTTKVTALPKDKQQQLLETNLQKLEEIHLKHPNEKVLVNSDSKTFLSHAAQRPYVHTIPGQIIHLDVESPQGTSTYNTYEKTFLDFFMIAHADNIYRLKTRWMHASGFPYAASLVYGKAFHPLTFPLTPHHP